MLNFSTFILVFLLVILPQVRPSHMKLCLDAPMMQVMLGHGLDIPATVRGNVSALSFFFDGEVRQFVSIALAY